MAEFDWNPEKDEWLRLNRGLSFAMVIDAFANGSVVDDIPNLAEGRSRQRILVIRAEQNYIAVPYVQSDEMIFLKTMYISRDLKARYGGDDAKTHH